MKLIDHIHGRVKWPVHEMSVERFEALASGYGGAAEIEELAQGQQSINRALVASIGGDGPAWDLLVRVDVTAAEHMDAVLAHPYVRVWAVACRRGEADPGHLAAIAASVAQRSGYESDLEVPVRGGLVYLPTLGTYQVGDRSAVTVADLAGHPRHPVRTLHAGGITVTLEDSDPYRDCHDWPAAPPLTDGDAARWQEMFAAAWQLIERDHAEYAPGLAAGLSTIVPLRPGPPGSDVSSTARHAFGSVAIALPADAATLALLLIHEYQHVKLGAVLDMFDLYDPRDTHLYYAPWRDDPRPLEGLLQGTYAHVAVADFWRVRRLVTTGAQADEAAAAFARWRWQTAEAIETLAGSGSLTPLGDDFVARMRTTVTPWLDEPVPPAAIRAAENSAHRHREAWSAARTE
jgi:uncharacterized protein